MTEEIPNRFDHAETCPRIYAAWEAAGCFNADANPDRQPYTIVIPPPNVTGALHLGHGLNNTLQDILIRLRRMQGYEALWMPGTDHAGIATQAVVEKRLKELENKTRHDLGREALVDRIWAWKEQYGTRILSQLKRMGCSCDWRRTRFTLDEVCAQAVRATFFDLFSKRLIYRGKRLVNWDTFLQTAISDDELFRETVKGHFWHIRYPVIDPKPGEPEFVTIATTRPETMLGDTAVAVHPNPDAAIKKAAKELTERIKTVASKELPALQKQLDTLEERRATMLPQLLQLAAMARDGRKLRLPLMNREIRLVADVWAKPELGSGAVKITPAHDPNDYEVARRCDLPMINILNPDGSLNDQTGDYQKLTIHQARKRVVADLEAAGLLDRVEDRDIEMAHSDRSKTAVEPYLADQWFVSMDQLAQSAMDAVADNRVQIFPERYRKGYLDWLGEKRDWPVSRQLWWGHRIPIWMKRCESLAEAKALQQELAAIKGATEQTLAIQVADDFTVQVCIREESSPLEAPVESLGFERDNDVLDTWFSSALWPHSTLGWPNDTAELKYFYPTSTLITSRDILTLWVARMVLMGLNNVGEVPFREVFIHPKILDRYGETMSKSKGNGVDPLDVIDKFGPDALRFGLTWLATDTQDVRMPVQYECPHCEKLVDQTEQNRKLVRVDCPECKKPFGTQWADSDEDRALLKASVVSERFEFARNFCNKLWNASRFTLLNLAGYESKPIEPRSLATEDRWLLSRINTVTGQVTEALQVYRYAEAARLLYDFAWDEFCSFYVEMAKPRLQDEIARADVQRVLATSLDQLLRLLHPVMPFITEEIWQRLSEVAPIRGLQNPTAAAKHLIRADWPTIQSELIDLEIEQRFARFQAVLAAIREIRSRQNINPREEVSFSVRCSEETARMLKPMTQYFQSLSNSQPTGFGPEVTSPPVAAPVTLSAFDLEVYIDLERFIDVPAELARNEKQRERLIGQITAKEQKLSNESFIARAPQDIVARERESLNELRQQLDTTHATIESLRKRN